MKIELRCPFISASVILYHVSKQGYPTLSLAASPVCSWHWVSSTAPSPTAWPGVHFSHQSYCGQSALGLSWLREVGSASVTLLQLPSVGVSQQRCGSDLRTRAGSSQKARNVWCHRWSRPCTSHQARPCYHLSLQSSREVRSVVLTLAGHQGKPLILAQMISPILCLLSDCMYSLNCIPVKLKQILYIF